MSRNERKKNLVGPYRNIHGAIWLIGLAIIAWQGWWWPGILVLVAFSLLFEALLMALAPHAFEEEQPLAPPPAAVTMPSAPLTPAAPVQEHRLELLPLNCPKCGGPLRGHEVKWRILRLLLRNMERGPREKKWLFIRYP